VNDLFAAWGLSAWKPWLESLLLSPLPLIAIGLAGGWRLHRRRRGGWALLFAGLLGLWAICSAALGLTLIDVLTRPPAALDAAAVERLRAAPRTAIVVLGAGRRWLAPEYGGADVGPLTLERLRYGLWLARRTGLPVAYSGGLSYGSPSGPTEAEIAREVAARDFGVPLRWVEDRSRDTAENAAFTVALLRAEGIERIVLVTHGFHQQRARAAFERALRRQGAAMELVSAGVGLRASHWLEIGDFLPRAYGLNLSVIALHEWLGWLAGA
jgi:uncharacterized SAM-binding protein YcdF (DUF218 family)